MMDGEGGTGATATPAAEDDKSLEKQLKELEKEKEDAQKAQVDANIADLTKLIEDAEKAEEDYAEAYDQLKDDEARLTRERDILSAALEAALKKALGDDWNQVVSKAVADKVEAVTRAETGLKNAKDALDHAQGEADAATETLKEKEAVLNDWRKPVDSIGKRQKSAQTLIDEIKKLRNNSQQSEAYWKLALGDPKNPDKIPGQTFLNVELAREPQVIPQKDLRGQIEQAWNNFTGARTAVAAKGLDLDEAKAAHKAAETASKDATKNLIKAITDALAAPDAPADAA